ncbi:MAG: gliding motility-associated C-terminal domain-containing protein [Bacteroidota bacterium]|nr:gliding motility-associated C-terminal domain-containing protein [Bacteroidota bacterium]
MKQVKCFIRPFSPFAGKLRVPVIIRLFVLLISAGSVIDVNADVPDRDPVLPPVAICRNISVQLGPGGTVTISGNDVNAGSYDPDGAIASLSVTPNTFNCTKIGPNPVILTVTDNEGLTSACAAVVTVEDKTPPVISCRDFTLYLNAAGTATLTVADINNGSSDDCSAGILMFLSRTSFNCSDVGAPASVTLTGTDGSGNSASCTSQVTVLDTISPVINVKPFELFLGPSGTGTLSPSDIDNGTFDNCSPVTLSVNPASFSCSDQGQKTVTLTAADAYGNSSSRDVVISVSSTLKITAMSLSTCDLSSILAIYESDLEGGDGNYSWLWKGLNPGSQPFMVIIPLPPSLLFSNTSTLESPFFNNTMPDGYYNVRLVVTDGNGCRDSSVISFNKSGALFNNQTFNNSTACEGEIETYSAVYKPDATYSWAVTNGTILTADSDTSSISVRWNMGATQGVVTANIQRPNTSFPGGQCQAVVTDTVTLTPVHVPVFNAFSANACSNAVATYSLTNSYTIQNWTVTGGVITAGGGSSDNFVTVFWGNGPAGTITVSVGDNITCLGSVSINIPIDNLTGNITNLTDITCNGVSDGTVTVAANPGSGFAPYMYSLDGGTWQANGTFTGLSLGNHSVILRDALLCTFDIPFIINQPALVSGTISAQTDVSCTGGSDGSVTITASGGVPPYQYRLNGGALQASNVFSGLSAGSYTVTVMDSHSCTATLPVTIMQPPFPVSGTVMITNVGCSGESTGRIDLTPSGGTPPFAYLWSNGAVTEDIINIPAGNYSVVITDSHGCTANVNATVTQPASAINGTVSVINVLCFRGTTGSIDLTVSGGTSPYSFTWSNGATTEDLSGIPAGSYSVTITDAAGCTALVNAIVTEPSSAVGGTVTSTTNVSCKGGSDGSFTVQGSGGVSPYEYQLGAGAFQSSGTFGSLAAGTYNITVRDANLCTFALQATVNEPLLALSATIATGNVKCYGDNTGACNLMVAGGTLPYTYLWSNGAVTEDITGLTPGTYSVTVTDSKGCTALASATVTQPASALSGTITSQTNVSTYGGNDGSVTVAGSGGTAPYEYKLDSGSFQASGTFGSLSAGTYTVTIRDTGLCTFDIPVTITQPWIPLTANIISQTNVKCFGGNTGSVTVAGWGGTSPYEYSINGGSFSGSGTFSSLIAGIYTITVRDAILDIFNLNINISEPTELAVAMSGEDVHCYGASTGTATATVTGGTTPYSYLWDSNPVQTAPSAAGLAAGTYTVTVTDANGCVSIDSVTILQPATDMTLSVTKVDPLCYGGVSGSATVQVNGGLAPYTYSWNTVPVQTKDMASNLGAGNYMVTVTDSYGCIKTGSVTLTDPLDITIGVTKVLPSCPDAADGSIILTVTGGSGPYTFLWSDNAGTKDRVGINAGTYTVIVTDQNGCAKSLVIDLDFTYSFNCLVIPQVITPNNDGYNDEWIIRNIDLYPDAELRVYNRWGKLVFSTRNPAANPWNGTQNGKLVPTDSYHYILYLNDGSAPKTGVISVIR